MFNFAKKIKIGPRFIAQTEPVFIIAEAGVNHNGDVNRAREMIKIAKAAGVDAIKFQSFKTENIIVPSAPKSTYHIKTTGSRQSWYDLLKTQELSREAHKILMDDCQRAGIIFLSTPYDQESADMLSELGVCAFKVASTDTNNIPFLRYLAGKKVPIILSTGMSSILEVEESLGALASAGGSEVLLTHCTSNYPAPLREVNLRAIATLRNKFSILVGYSDHTPGVVNPVAATALGAVLYEKHFTLDKTLPGPDHPASLSPDELVHLVKLIRETETALGIAEKICTECEQENRLKLRKGLISTQFIPAHSVIRENMMTIKRPGFGLAPKYFDIIQGKKTRQNIDVNTPINHADILWED